MMLRFPKFPALLLLALGAGAAMQAQLSLNSAVDLALRNSPRVKMAEADVAKARAAWGEAKDAYVPQVSTSGGYGRSTGAPLSVPIVFSMSAQSLVYTSSQPDYIRAAKASVDATEEALTQAEIEVFEDAANTYLALDNALERRAVLRDEQDITRRLVDVTGERVDAGVDARIELTKSKRTSAQIRLLLLQLEDEIGFNQRHLATLTGTALGSITTDHSSIPQFSRPVDPSVGNDAGADSAGIKAAFAIAKSKEFTARGDRHYLFRPQVSLQANYSRVDTGLSSYAQYYPRFAGVPGGPANSSNALGVGLSINIPLLDLAHRSRARQSAADAAHAFAEANMQRGQFLEGRARLRNSTLELDARAELARLDREMAADQLDTLRVQMQAGAANLAGPQVTPKDELNAQLQERQRYWDVLNAELQLRQTQVNLLRQQGGLGDWIHGSIGTSTPGTTAPGASVLPAAPATAPVTPSVPGGAPTPTAPSPSGTPPGLPSTPVPQQQ